MSTNITIPSQLTSRKETNAVEEAVLGACLLEQGTFDKVAHLLKEQDFLLPFHKSVWAALVALSVDGTPIDIITVSQKLGGKAYEITMLTNRVVSSENIINHAYLIKQNSLTYQLGIHVLELHKGITEGRDPFELLAKVQTDSQKMTQRLFEGRTVNHAETVDTELNSILDAMVAGTPEPRTNTGFKELDAILNGLKDGNLCILAARPGMGKTALALNIISNICRSGGKCAFFSLEMPRGEIIRRLLAAEARVMGNDINNAHLLTNNAAIRLQEAGASIREWKLFTDDSATATVLSIRSQCMQYKNANGGLDLVVVDYLQLMQEGGKGNGNREQEIASISRGLKILAKDLGCPVIALSQLSRNCENRPDKRPLPSDLRESGAIEQDADSILFVFRPEVYFSEDEEGNSTKGVAEIICAKNRNGGVGVAKLSFYGPLFLFTDFDQKHMY